MTRLRASVIATPNVTYYVGMAGLMAVLLLGRC